MPPSGNEVQAHACIGLALCLGQDAPTGGADRIAGLRVADDGSLSVAGYVESESGPRAMGLDTTERFLFSTGGNSGYISVCRIDRDTGALTRVDRAPLADGQRRATGERLTTGERGSVPMWVCSTSDAARHVTSNTEE